MSQLPKFTFCSKGTIVIPQWVPEIHGTPLQYKCDSYVSRGCIMEITAPREASFPLDENDIPFLDHFIQVFGTIFKTESTLDFITYGIACSEYMGK